MGSSNSKEGKGENVESVVETMSVSRRKRTISSISDKENLENKKTANTTTPKSETLTDKANKRPSVSPEPKSSEAAEEKKDDKSENKNTDSTVNDSDENIGTNDDKNAGQSTDTEQKNRDPTTENLESTGAEAPTPNDVPCDNDTGVTETPRADPADPITVAMSDEESNKHNIESAKVVDIDSNTTDAISDNQEVSVVDNNAENETQKVNDEAVNTEHAVQLEDNDAKNNGEAETGEVKDAESKDNVIDNDGETDTQEVQDSKSEDNVADNDGETGTREVTGSEADKATSSAACDPENSDKEVVNSDKNIDNENVEGEDGTAETSTDQTPATLEDSTTNVTPDCGAESEERTPNKSHEKTTDESCENES